ncbi:MAG TPA: hypothetical protein VFR09_04200 [Alphaproteobacteria bacterium]|nr:hypothetical protein [Alphaproteobacteria bacterium]
MLTQSEREKAVSLITNYIDRLDRSVFNIELQKLVKQSISERLHTVKFDMFLEAMFERIRDPQHLTRMMSSAHPYSSQTAGLAGILSARLNGMLTSFYGETREHYGKRFGKTDPIDNLAWVDLRDVTPEFINEEKIGYVPTNGFMKTLVCELLAVSTIFKAIDALPGMPRFEREYIPAPGSIVETTLPKTVPSPAPREEILKAFPETQRALLKEVLEGVEDKADPLFREQLRTALIERHQRIKGRAP